MNAMPAHYGRRPDTATADSDAADITPAGEIVAGSELMQRVRACLGETALGGAPLWLRRSPRELLWVGAPTAVLVVACPTPLLRVAAGAAVAIAISVSLWWSTLCQAHRDAQDRHVTKICELVAAEAVAAGWDEQLSSARPDRRIGALAADTARTVAVELRQTRRVMAWLGLTNAESTQTQVADPERGDRGCG